MSESHRDHDRSSTRSFSHAHGHAKVDPDRSSRKRSHLDSENIDAKVYVRNLPTKKATDDELLDFFRPYGKISDIRVFKDHIFVQYNRVEDANRLIKDAQVPLLFKGVQLDILPAREVRSTSSKSSSTDRSSRRNYDHRSSSTYEPERKRCASRERLSSNEPKPVNSPLPYAVLTGPKDTDAFVDCQIIIVNVRQREYAEEIESRLRPHRLITSIILLREDYTLVKAIDNAARLQCLYGIIAMPMHEERRTASFHILYGETEEHRNLAMEDGVDIIVKNFVSFKKRLRGDEPEPYQSNNDAVVYSSSSPAYDVQHQSSHPAHDQITPPVLALGDKLPLSMLLCLLADGRQLTLEEIDRVLVYLLEKKAKMLTLPPGTLPPLPAQYATVATYGHAPGSAVVSDTRPASRSDHSPGKSSSSSTADASSVIAEQIRQILSSNIAKPNSSTGETISPPIVNEPLKIDRPNAPAVSNNSIKDSPKDFASSSHNIQSPFAFAKSEPTPAIPPPFNYVATNFPSLPLNPALKPATPLSVPNFVSPASSYFYQVPGQSVYQSPLNTTAAATTAANTAAALFQAYSQYTVQPNGTSPMINQPISAAQPPIRK